MKAPGETVDPSDRSQRTNISQPSMRPVSMFITGWKKGTNSSRRSATESSSSTSEDGFQ